MAPRTTRFYYRGPDVRLGDLVTLPDESDAKVLAIVQPHTPGCECDQGGIWTVGPGNMRHFFADPLVDHDIKFRSRRQGKRSRFDHQAAVGAKKLFYYRGPEVRVGDIVRMPTSTIGTVFAITQPDASSDIDGGVLFEDPKGFGWLEEDPWSDEDMDFIRRADEGTERTNV